MSGSFTGSIDGASALKYALQLHFSSITVSSQEMATSMGESFWNRFKQSQQQKKDRGDDKEVCDANYSDSHLVSNNGNSNG